MKTIFSRLTSLAAMASRRSDVVVALFLMMAVIMIVIPLPTAVVDVLIAFNMALSLLTLVVAFYVSRPSEFSALPPIILIGTLFRLALSITTTRLILLQADAGHIVSAFGSFVIGGEVVVGLVVFLIITIAQFIVITKGSERVAEVAARFTLDAMPGKQMSIDNDLRSGDIQPGEAKARRSLLERENQLYGAMDGAMKFVKGDAIAGLVIVFVNLIGGLLIGMLQHDMTFAAASHTYSLLTVGDGLIAQIPALLISIGAGTVVTRVASDVGDDLGSEIVRQLGSSDRALALAAVILFAASFVPGFPMVVFLSLSALLGGAAYMIHRKKANATALVEAAAVDKTNAAEAKRDKLDSALVISEGSTRHRISAAIGSGLSGTISAESFVAECNEAREMLQAELGMEIPAVQLHHEASLPSNGFRINLERVPVIEGEIPTGEVLLQDDPTHLELLQIDFTRGSPLLTQKPSVWVRQEHLDVMRDAGIGYLETTSILTRSLAKVLRQYAAHFMGIQETRELLNGMETDQAELVREVLGVVPLKKLSEVLRRLIEEEVSINSLRVVLETIVECEPHETETALLVEKVRMALGRQICHRYAAMNQVVTAYVLAHAAEDAVRGAMKRTPAGMILALPDAVGHSLAQQVRQEVGAAEEGATPTLVVAHDIRRAVRNFLVRNDIAVPVLSYREIAPEFSLQSLSSITLPTTHESQRHWTLERTAPGLVQQPA